MPTGKAERSRSSATPALSRRAAPGPVASSAACRCDTSTRPCGTSAKAASSFSISGAGSESSAIKSHSSGLCQIAARGPFSVTRRGCNGGAGPKAAAARAASSRPRRISRVANLQKETSAWALFGAARRDRGERRIGSGVKALALLVVEDRLDDLRGPRTFLGHHMDAGADPAATAGNERHREAALQDRTPISGCHMAERRRADRGPLLANDLGAFIELQRGVFRQKADELFTAFARQVLHLERAFADEIRLVPADHFPETKIVRRHRAVCLLTDDDETLFGAQDQQRVEAVDNAVNLASLRPDRLPDCTAIIGRHIDFESKFAGKANAGEPRRNPADATLADREMRHGGG